MLKLIVRANARRDKAPLLLEVRERGGRAPRPAGRVARVWARSLSLSTRREKTVFGPSAALW